VTTVEADVAIVGSGVVGALVARPLLQAGERVVMLERGGRKSHAEQLRDGAWSNGAPGAAFNHEVAPGHDPYPWNYVYGVGGSTLRWSGVAPRLAEGDLRMRSAYGVMEDWPISYDELVPFYERAEAALAVAGGPGAPDQPAHPFSPLDRVLEPLLHPYVPMPQARPSRATGGRPACCGATTCDLCPVDARFTVLNALRQVLEHPALELRAETVAARIVRDASGRRARAIEAIGPKHAPLTIHAPRIVLAAGGFENPAVLLRSGIHRPGTGDYLFDHAHRTLLVHARDPVGTGHGATIATGLSEAWLEGAFRSERSGAVVSPYNPGIQLVESVADGLLATRRGAALRREVANRWSRTVPLDVLLEDLPQRARRIELAPTRDALGLPRIRVHYGPCTAYEEDGWRAVRAELERRLAPLRPVHVEERRGPAGSHLLGTCRMTADGSGVVDRDLRHLDVENLWVAGGSAFPTYGSLHPTLTMAALAIRLGDQLAAGT
jgi:choline dehydrogenase-like flavoprotein